MKECSITTCPLTEALTVIGGKWKATIIFQLSKSNKRFGQLDVAIPGISRKVLTTHLNELVEDKLIMRHSFKETPPRVVYELSEKAKELIPIFTQLYFWGEYLLEEKQGVVPSTGN